MISEITNSSAIPFEFFASFTRIRQGNPILACRPPEWAAATHALVVENTLHYYWAKRTVERRWLLMHATAPAADPSAITQDATIRSSFPQIGGSTTPRLSIPFHF
jgi:hypothetical protein